MNPQPRKVMVFAAASLSGVMHDMTPRLKQHEGIRLVVHTAGSGTLAQQLKMGAPADVFISANVRWMNELAKDGLIDRASRFNLLRNELVLIASESLSDPPRTLAQLADFHGRIAIGEPTSVPAGHYAKQSLQAAGVWNAVRDHLAPAVDVRAALAYVVHGEAPIGIVYATDAAASNHVRVAAAIPANLHQPIVYPVAILTHAANPRGARRLLDWLRTDEAKVLFENAGFEPLADSH